MTEAFLSSAGSASAGAEHAPSPRPARPSEDSPPRASAGPWLDLPLAGPVRPGRWVRLRYRTSLLDDAVRPLLRFTTAAGTVHTEPLTGALWGTGEWTGRLPDGIVALAVASGSRQEGGALEVLSLEAVPLWRVLRQGMRRDRGRALLSLGIWLFADRPAGERLLKLLAATTPLQEYGSWRAGLGRPLDVAGCDAPRADWSRTPPIRLVARAAGAGPDDLRRTLASLTAQAYPRWSLALVPDGASPALLDAAGDAALAEARVVAPGTAPDPGPADTWWGEIRLGDTLPEHALAAMAELAARAPWLRAAYGDEEIADGEGRPLAPRLKPDWSPVFLEGEDYVGRLALVRAGALAQARLGPADLAREPAATLRRVLRGASQGEVGHLRRILYRRMDGLTPTRAPAGSERVPAAAAEPPPVAVVIPVRDRADLLERCADGLLHRTAYPALEVLVIDNGSVEPRTHALLERLKADRRVTVMPRPGPFNYAALCNEGAAATRAPLLLFLNSDIDVIGPDWLARLADYAIRPDVGAVGAKLLYPDGSLQHAGVTVGLNGFAGHLYSGAPRGEPGHMGELLMPHEVSAVTGACLAVEREKLDAVGGYDAQNLPVDLNDVDLCLRLGERGWRTIWTPHAELYHLESASRGRAVRGSKVYSKERSYFRERWAHVIRDDPYYHPALSLVARSPVLG